MSSGPLLRMRHAHLAWQVSSARVRDGCVTLHVLPVLSREKVVQPEKECLHQPSQAERPEPGPALCSVLRFAFNSAFCKLPWSILCPVFHIRLRGTPRLLIKHSAHAPYSSTVSVQTSLNISCLKCTLCAFHCTAEWPVLERS